MSSRGQELNHDAVWHAVKITTPNDWKSRVDFGHSLVNTMRKEIGLEHFHVRYSRIPENVHVDSQKLGAIGLFEMRNLGNAVTSKMATIEQIARNKLHNVIELDPHNVQQLAALLAIKQTKSFLFTTSTIPSREIPAQDPMSKTKKSEEKTFPTPVSQTRSTSARDIDRPLANKQCQTTDRPECVVLLPGASLFCMLLVGDEKEELASDNAPLKC